MHASRSHPSSLARIVAAITFAAMGVFLVIYLWPPPTQTLTREQGRVAGVAKGRNDRYEATIVTASGATLTCRGRKSAVAWASRCPVAELEALIGADVTVAHNGHTPYVIEHAGITLLGPDNYRSAQVTAVALAALLLAMAGVALWHP